MALRECLCTPLDVRNLSEWITTEVRGDARITQAILLEDAILRGSLRGLYANGDTDLLDPDGSWHGSPQPVYPYQGPTGLVANTGTGCLRYVTLGVGVFTETWILTFTSTTAFSVYGTYSGGQAAGSTTQEYTNTIFTIPTAAWARASGGTPSFAVGDQFLFSTYRWNPLIVAIAAKMAAGSLITGTFHGISEETIKHGENLKKEARAHIEALQSPYIDKNLRLPTFSARDISPEGISYTIDALGQDLSPYSDIAQTPWSEYQSGLSFLWGPTWTRL